MPRRNAEQPPENRQGAVGPGVTNTLIAALASWQLSVIRFNDAVAADLGIASSDLQCLFVLDRRGNSSPSEIARQVNLTTGATSRMIERLLQAGMVTRDHDVDDRRRVNVSITAPASDALHGRYDPLDDALRELLDTMSPDTLSELLQFTRQAETQTGRLNAVITSQTD